jgi:hypothetical protein
MRRTEAIQAWLAARADRPVGRLGIRWWKAYFAASRNSACAASIYSALSVLPMALVGIAYLHPGSGDVNALADRIVTHLHLRGETASLVHSTFGTASDNVVSATVAATVGFLLWGIGIGQLYRDLYARAWGLGTASTAADQMRFTVFFFAFSGVGAAGVVSATALHGLGWAVTICVWLVASVVFWLWVPWFLLRRAIGLGRLLPGALVASVLLGGTIATSPLWLSPTMNQNGAAFGSFGIVLTLLAYLFILITMTMVAAVFAPAWAGWRGDRAHGAAG